MKVCVIGLGRVGTALLSALISSNLDISEISLYDKNAMLMVGQLNDARDMVEVMGKNVEIRSGVDREADVFILTLGKPRKSGSSDFDFEANLVSVAEVLPMCDLDKPIFLVTNPVKRLAKSIKRHFSLKQLVLIGDLLDQAREKRTGVDGEGVARFILDNKGYTNLGCVGEILVRLKKLEAGVHGGNDAS